MPQDLARKAQFGILAKQHKATAGLRPASIVKKGQDGHLASAGGKNPLF